MSRWSLTSRAWREQAARIIERDGGRCTVCGSTEDLTVDHVVPVSLMDDDDRAARLDLDPANLVTLCRRCNSAKGDRPGPARPAWHDPRFFP